MYEIERARLMKTIKRYFGNENDAVAHLDVLDGLKDMGAVLSGGAITSTFNNVKVNDLDFYLQNESDSGRFHDFMKKCGLKAACVTENAVTYVRNGTGKQKYYVQLVSAFSGSPEEIFSTYDFTVCCGAFSFAKAEFELHPRFLSDNISKRLVYIGGSKFPLCALYRVRKYLDKGYTVTGGTLVHIGLCATKLNINTYGDLKQQLRGVDTMFLGDYFASKEDSLPCIISEAIDEVFGRLEELAAEKLY